MTSKVVNIYKDTYDVYIGRGGKGQDGYFGNPFVLSLYETREACIAEYRKYFYDRIANDPEFKERIEGLRGKRLGCFCAPKLLCHGMIIVEYLDGKTVEEQIKDGTSTPMPSLFDDLSSYEK